MTPDLPSFLEDRISQIPALQFLQNMGWEYVTPAETVQARGGKLGQALLERVLAEQLRQMNRIRFKGGEHPFSEANIQTAIQTLKEQVFDGLVRTNEKIYDLLVLGKSLQQTIDGDTKSFPLKYIDWNPETWLTTNKFQVTSEYEVERTASNLTRRPDIVLFVNGIPLAVIECKRSDQKGAVDEAVSQQIGNQRDDQIPKLFIYSQLLLAVSKNDAKYGTTGTAAKFWAVWKEEIDKPLKGLVSKPLSAAQKERLFGSEDAPTRAWFDQLEKEPREITEQDRALYSLCRPERLLDLAHNFTLFDGGEKKVARYQQYFTVRNAMERIRQRDPEGKRRGGVVWHTQGSGKSLTMVMLAKMIAQENLPDYKIVLVTDRVDLDDQIYRTFSHCDMDPHRARSGRDLASQLMGSKGRVVTTVIDKFENAIHKGKLQNDSDNIFVLVDESHRGQFGNMHSLMKKALPNACFIGFTGTPVEKKEKTTIGKFGGLIQPTYTIRKAVEDRAVVPLLYEGRDVEQLVDKKSIDKWFDVITGNLTAEQKADLKRKFARTDQLNKAEQRVKEIALDISTHFRDNWQGTPFRGQLVAQDKSTALLYKKYLDEFGMVSAEVVISAPDEREGNAEVEEQNLPDVQQFWKKMMAKHGSEEQYNKNVINGFKHGDGPEIIIVVDKLLTGFDAPRNTVLYLTRQLKEHTLLQAIARVNRLCDGKDFGYIIDYRGVLQNLNHAFDLYGKLEDFDPADLEMSLADVGEEIEKLPRRHTDLVNLFQDVKNKQDEELYELKLADEALREKFRDRLREFAKSLGMALGSSRFVANTPQEKINKYREDFRFFMRLRASVGLRYADVVDFKEYEPKIQKLIDTHVTTGGVEKVTELVNIFDEEAFRKEVEKKQTTASKADTIAHRTKKVITERMQDDPAFYRKFSEMLEEAIRAFRQGRLDDKAYLTRVTEIQNSVVHRKEDNLPRKLDGREIAKAFYGVVLEAAANLLGETGKSSELAADLATGMDDIVLGHRIVNWVNNTDVQNRMRLEMEDLVIERIEAAGKKLDFDTVDVILERVLDIAKRRYAE